jgi:hypothetical protein
MADGEEKAEAAPVRRKLPIVIKLEEPIESGEGMLSEIVIRRRPIGADWSGFSQNPTILDYQRVGARLANLPLPIIKKMDTKATFELVEVLGSFLE